MAKKKTKAEVPAESALEAKKPVLTKEQYWEWRTTIAELELSKKALEIANLHLNAAKKEIEVLNLKTQLFALGSIKTAEKEAKEAQDEYETTKNRLESILGVSFNGKIIDAITLEVKDAPSPHGS